MACTIEQMLGRPADRDRRNAERYTCQECGTYQEPVPVAAGMCARCRWREEDADARSER